MHRRDALPAGRILPTENRADLAGIGGALLAVAIWAGWLVFTRQAVTGALTSVELGLLRFGVPALVLAPWWWRAGLLPRGQKPWLIILMIAGSGAPFFLVAGAGLARAPAAHAGVLMPGTMPLLVALLGLALGERISRARLAGFGLVLAGVLLVGARSFSSDPRVLTGDGLILAGAALWAVYTQAFRRSGLDPLTAAALTSIWSALLLLALLLGQGGGFASVGWGEIATGAVVQGVLSGLVALLAYGAAVRRLGASRAAAFSALAPALATVIAIPVLGEWPTGLEVLGVIVTTAGVAIASGALAGVGGRGG